MRYGIYRNHMGCNANLRLNNTLLGVVVVFKFMCPMAHCYAFRGSGATLLTRHLVGTFTGEPILIIYATALFGGPGGSLQGAHVATIWAQGSSTRVY